MESRSTREPDEQSFNTIKALEVAAVEMMQDPIDLPLSFFTQGISSFNMVIDKFHCNCGEPKALEIVYDLKERSFNDKLYSQNEYCCDICYTLKKVTQSGIIHCDRCKMDICESCAGLILQDMGRYSCQYGHILKFLPDQALPMHLRTSQFQCNVCGFKESMYKRHWKCEKCKWYKCSDCSVFPVRCKYEHQLHRVKELKKGGGDGGVDGKEIIKCSLCKKAFQNRGIGMLHCSECEFQLCDWCLITQRSDLKRYCPSKHLLLREPDLSKCGDAELYVLNQYVCDVCRQKKDNYEGLVLHCDPCGYDICPDCAMK